MLILTECWLSCAPTLPRLEGYNCFNTIHHHKQNDGVVVYIKNNLTVATEDPNLTNANCLILKISHDTVIIAIYRSPSWSNVLPFLTALNEILTKLTKYQNILIFGDLNISINSVKYTEDSENFLNLIAFYGVLPAHTLVTRDITGTCIDHVLLKTNKLSRTLVVDSTITDHKAVLSFLYNISIGRAIEKSVYTSINYEGLKSQLLLIDLDPIFISNDPEYAMSFLIEKLTKAVQNNTKTATISKRRKIIKPWITPGLLRCLRNRDHLHLKSKRDPNNESLLITYKRYRNHCNNIIKKVRRAYDKELITKAGSDNRKIWKAIKKITNTSNKTRNYPKELLSVGSDPQNSVNIVNDYFTNIGKKLAQEITMDSAAASSNVFLTPTSQLHSFALVEADQEEIEQLIMGLKNDSATGHDKISNKLLKDLKSFLAPALTHIFNICFRKGIFPSSLKKSVVIPIYKEGDRDLINNYRPISLLPSLSKILEKLLNNRLTQYLEKYQIISDNQFGFRQGRSTSDAVYSLTDYLIRNIDSNKKCLTIFLDLAKAFDTVSVPLLLEKLENIGIRNIQLQLFKSYLSERTQRVLVGQYSSTDLPVSYGIPQGSILGPTLFLVYINELCSIPLTQCKIISYADDTALAFSGDSWSEVFEMAQRGLNKISMYLRKNILSLNVNKTKYICFSIRKTNAYTHHNLIAHNCTSLINCSCPNLEPSTHLKYLGVIVDNNLTFRPHILSISKKIRKLMTIFKKLRNVLDPKQIKSTYYALCQSLCTYCIQSWGGTAKTILRPLEIAQRAVLKISSFRHFRYPTRLLYQNTKLLTIRQLYVLTTILKQHSELKFDPILLTKRNAIICHQSTQFKTAFSNRFYAFLGPYLYNKANKQLSIYANTKTICKKKVINWLLSLTYDDTEDLLIIIQ